MKDPIQILADAKGIHGNGEDKYPIDASALEYPDNLNDLLPPKPMPKWGPPKTFQQMDELDPGIFKYGDYQDIMPRAKMPEERDPEHIYSDSPYMGGIKEKTLPFRAPPKEGFSKWWEDLNKAIDSHINRRNSSGAPGPGEYDVEKERHHMKATPLMPDKEFYSDVGNRLQAAFKGGVEDVLPDLNKPLDDPESIEKLMNMWGMGAIKGVGGMWHPEAVRKLSGPLSLGMREPLELGPPGKSSTNWSEKAIKNYLNRYAGTEKDPLKDIEIPSGQGTERWEDLWDKAVTSKPAGSFKLRKPVEGHPGLTSRSEEAAFPNVPPQESIYNIADHGVYQDTTRNALGRIHSYLSHVGDYLRQHVVPGKLQSYDLTRAVKETAEWDKKLAAKMNSLEGKMEGTIPFKQYPDKFQWVEVGKGTPLKELPPGYKLDSVTEKDVKRMIRIDQDFLSTTPKYDIPSNRKTPTTKDFYLYEPGGSVVIDTKYGATYPNKEAALEALARKQGHEALRHEGDIMGHCAGGYCNMVDNAESKIYSLRDPKGASHVTIEVSPKGPIREEMEPGQHMHIGEQQLDEITQIKGKQNKAPNPEYLPYVQDFIKSGNWGHVGELENAGLIDRTLWEGGSGMLGGTKHPFSEKLDKKFGKERYVPQKEIEELWRQQIKDTGG